MEQVNNYRADRKNESQHIHPKGRADLIGQVFVKPQLQEQGCQSDRSDDHHRQRAQKRATTGVEDNQRQRKQEKSGRNNSPAAGLRRRRLVGSGVRQWISAQSYTSRAQGFQWYKGAIGERR